MEALAATVTTVYAGGEFATAETSDVSHFASFTEAGSLTFATMPTMPTLTPITIDGEAQTTFTTMTNFKVKDATATGAGWNVTLSGREGAGLRSKLTQYCPEAACGAVGYVSGGHQLEADSLTLRSTGATFEPASEAPVFKCATGCSLDTGSETAVAVVEAAQNHGIGVYEAKGWTSESLSLATPQRLYALPAHEVYRVDLLWTLSSGP